MSVQSSFKRTFIAIAAALMTSTLAVGAAVGPAHASGTLVKVSANA